jgi:hypothetical protein
MSNRVSRGIRSAAKRAHNELATEYFGDQDGRGGIAEEWTLHKRKTWAAGAEAALKRLKSIAAEWDSLCEDCVSGDHDDHDEALGGICVGCSCEKSMAVES